MISQQIRLIATILLLAPIMVAHAQWSSDPALNNPICRAGNNQRAPRLVSDGKGGAIICWYDERATQNFFDVYAQRIDSDGFVRWTVNGIAISTAFNLQLNPEIISDDAGGAIIVWTDTRSGNNDIYAQRVDSSGNVLWMADGVPVASGSTHQSYPRLISDGRHGAIVTWNAHTGANQDSHIYAQRIDGEGNLAWNPEVPVSTAEQFESSPCIASDGSGGAYIAWSFYNTQGEYDVFAQRIDSSGVPQWQYDGIGIGTGSGAQDSPALVADGTGKAFLTYYDWGSGSTAKLQVVVLNTDGSKVASFRATSTTGGQANPQLSNIGTGLLGIVWEDGRLAGKTRSYTQIIDNTGHKSWAADGVEVSSRTGDQVTPFIISDGNGGVIVSWEDKLGGVVESDIYAQRIPAVGSPLWSSTGVPVGTAVRMQQYPWMISDGQNGAIVTWEDYRPSFSNTQIYASRILADGTFPIGPPILAFSSNSVVFGAVSVGSTSTKNITLTNTGDVPVTISSVISSDPHFSLTPDSNTISPNSSVAAMVRFQPTSRDTLNAHIVVQSNSIFGPDTVKVTGSGTASAAIEIDRPFLNFGNVKIGSSKSLALNISNPGNDTLIISSITTNDPGFTVAITSRVLAPGGAFDDTVHFSPTAPGPVSGELTLTSNAPTSPTILPLSGMGIAEVTMTIDPAEISFGDVAIDSYKDTTLTITNTGNDTLRISSFTSGDPRFTLETPSEAIAPAGLKTFTLRFTPNASGPFSTVFIVTSNAVTSPDTIAVHGTGSDVSAVRSLQVLPGAFTLFQNYPNPFHSSTIIRYELEMSAPVHGTVYNSRGQVVVTLVDETQHPGVHTVQWAPEGSTPGVYFLVLRVGAYAAYGRIVLMH